MVKLPRPQIQKYIGQFKLDCSMYNYSLIWYGILLQPNCFLCDIVTFAPSFVLTYQISKANMPVSCTGMQDLPSAILEKKKCL